MQTKVIILISKKKKNIALISWKTRLFFWLQNMKWESRVFIRDELLTREQRLSSWWNHQLRAKSCGLLAWREVRRTSGFRIGWVRNKSYDIFTYIIIIFHTYRGRKIQKNFVLFSCEKLQESFHSVLYYCISICAGAESSPPLSETSAAFLTHCIERKRVERRCSYFS